MESPSSHPDWIIDVLVAAGALQLAWVSVMLARRGLRPAIIQQAVRPLFAVWVLMWPLYGHPLGLWLGLAVLVAPLLLAATGQRAFWRALRHAWGVPPHRRGSLPEALQLLPMAHFLLALGIAAAFFAQIPEFGFGLGLALCLAFPGADTIDRLGWLPLGFPAHADQTLAGHLLLIALASLAMSWSLHVYHDIDAAAGLIATTIAAIGGSIARAVVPGSANQPVAVAIMGGMLWLL